MKNRRLTRRIIVLSGFLIFFMIELACLAQNSADAILGEWYSPDKDGKFLFYKVDGRYFGKLVWVKEPNDANGNPKLDKANPDPAKRNHTMLGLVVFTGFYYDAEANEWIEGKVYDARNGDTYCCRLRLISSLVLEARGYILFSWLGKSAYFTRNK